MIEAAARAWPEHALVTGVTDNEFSHTAPDQSSALDVAYQTWPAGTEALRLRAQSATAEGAQGSAPRSLERARVLRVAAFLALHEAYEQRRGRK